MHSELVDGGVPAGSIEFRQLDLDDDDSVAAFAGWVAAEHGTIGALVNNAAIAFNSTSTEPFAEQAAPTVFTNYTQTRKLTDALLPCLDQDDGRVVFVASGSGPSAFADCSVEMQARVRAASRDDLTALAAEFVAGVEGGTHEEAGWPSNCYGVSKMCAPCASVRQLSAADPLLLRAGC